MVGNHKERSFGLLPQVKIQAVDSKHVSFSTRSESRSGDPRESLLRTFTVPRTDVYTHPIPGAPESVKLHIGASGPIYLSQEGLDAKSSDGFGIYGAKRARVKFPLDAAMPSAPITQLTVVPASIHIRGHLEGGKRFFDLELLGPDAVEPQDIVWSGADCIELKLTEDGLRHLHVKSSSTTVRVWPIEIWIEGAPSSDRSVSGKVNLLDSENADSIQRITFASHGAPIVLGLTGDGLGRFHVSPQMLDAASSRAAASPAMQLET